MNMFVPPQSLREELVDDPAVDRRWLQGNLRDMAAANRRLGAERAVLAQTTRWLAAVPANRTPTVLDIGTGNGTLLRRLDAWSTARGEQIALVGCDISAAVLQVAQRETDHTPIRLLRCDALRLPFGDRTVDVVVCVQALHHFGREAAERLVQEAVRVARCGVIISDLRRSWAAYWGARVLALGPVSPLSRHDGPLSVLRAYTPHEAAQIVRDAGSTAQIRQRMWGMDLIIGAQPAPLPTRAVTQSL